MKEIAYIYLEDYFIILSPSFSYTVHELRFVICFFSTNQSVYSLDF